MKFTWGLGIVIVLGLGLSSCFDPPEYSVIPEIEFENIVFKDIADPSAVDSLLLFIKFRDGDGNLGLDGSELGCYLNESDTICYIDKFTFLNQNEKKVTNYQGVKGELITYATKRTNPNFAYLPDYVKPYDCTNWELIYDNSPTPVLKDTVYFELNPNHYNIFVDFLVKQNDGSFQEFDWQTEFCTTFDGRFPILAKNHDLSLTNPVEGTLKYAMVTAGFKLQFSIKTVKLRIQIQDRLLNRSNIIETPEFQFK